MFNAARLCAYTEEQPPCSIKKVGDINLFFHFLPPLLFVLHWIVLPCDELHQILLTHLPKDRSVVRGYPEVAIHPTENDLQHHKKSEFDRFLISQLLWSQIKDYYLTVARNIFRISGLFPMSSSSHALQEEQDNFCYLSLRLPYLHHEKQRSSSSGTVWPCKLRNI